MSGEPKGTDTPKGYVESPRVAEDLARVEDKQRENEAYKQFMKNFVSDPEAQQKVRELLTSNPDLRNKYQHAWAEGKYMKASKLVEEGLEAGAAVGKIPAEAESAKETENAKVDHARFLEMMKDPNNQKILNEAFNGTEGIARYNELRSQGNYKEIMRLVVDRRRGSVGQIPSEAESARSVGRSGVESAEPGEAPEKYLARLRRATEMTLNNAFKNFKDQKLEFNGRIYRPDTLAQMVTGIMGPLTRYAAEQKGGSVDGINADIAKQYADLMSRVTIPERQRPTA